MAEHLIDDNQNMAADKRVSFFDLRGVESLRAQFRLEPRRLQAVRTRLWKDFVGKDVALAELPASARCGFERRIAFHPLRLQERIDSNQDGATKLVFRTAAGFLVEAVVLRAASGRTALCVSCQVGCAAGCSFCATGQMGVAHSLSAGEILDQMVQAGELLHAEGRRVRNIVFMAMGEPFHNEKALYAAIDALLGPKQFHHPPRYLLVSTVGIPDAMIRFARRFPNANLALSLHSSEQQVREQIIPLAARHDVTALRDSIQSVNRIQKRPVMIEYLMLRDFNDSPAAADHLIAYLRDLDVHVNLIPYNPIADAPGLLGTDKAGRERFARHLKRAGLTTTIRYSLGSDIAAACGQLVRRENREIARQNAFSR